MEAYLDGFEGFPPLNQLMIMLGNGARLRAQATQVLTEAVQCGCPDAGMGAGRPFTALHCLS